MDKNSRQKKMGRVTNRTVLIAIVLLISVSIPQAYAQDAEIHRKGKEYIRARKWEKAIETYDRLVNEYPHSLYSDDAQFWVAFCWEQIQGQEKIAFEEYQRVINSHPLSPWVDDAIIHQVSLAKKLAQRGEERYRVFLLEKLDDDKPIRTQAALALGELRDPSVLTILEEMAKGADEESARRAMDILEGYTTTLEETVEKEMGAVEETEDTLESSDKEAASGIFYEKLGASEADWTEERLFLNGLYHIVSQEELIFFLSLENEWDRKEWWRKHWAAHDPTPTTPENEAEEEFKRRVLYVRKHFGKEWDSTEEYYPPWDSRGELYIKFGNPDRREEAENDWEIWTYYQHKINFLVSNHLSNRNGKGLHLGTVSRYLYRNNIRRSRNRFLQRPIFMYINPATKTVKKIEGFSLRITSTSRTGSTYRIRFTYQFPTTNLRLRQEKDRYEGGYRYRWMVLDEDYHTVLSSDAIEELTFQDQEKRNQSTVMGNFHVTLVPGSYTLAMRIEDTRSNALGIYRKKFTIQVKGEIEEPAKDEQIPDTLP